MDLLAKVDAALGAHASTILTLVTLAMCVAWLALKGTSRRGRAPKDTAPLPGRGRPAHRDNQLIESPEVWLADKRALDRERLGGALTDSLWAVHGKLYDLEPYLDRHPGGRAFLELTRGSDVTDAFEVHHIDDAKAWAVLAKYYVSDCQPPPPQQQPPSQE